MHERERSLDALLDLDGQILVVSDEGHFAKFLVKRIEPTESRPHGLSYSLTLHDRNGRRLLGFDNAHTVKRPGGRFVEQVRIYDHVHRRPGDPGRPYRFLNPGQLLEDFWVGVDRILNVDEG